MPSKKKPRRRPRRKQSILGPLFLELLALVIFGGLFFAVQESREEQRTEIEGSFPSVAYSEQGPDQAMARGLANTGIGWPRQLNWQP